MTRPSRRAVIDRWITSLTPYFEVIHDKAMSLRLGQPRLEGPPTYLDIDNPGDRFGKGRIRKNAIWFINGANVGFHVDFYPAGIHIEAWTGKDRHASVWISGKVTEKSLKRDLTMVLAAAGLNDLARTDEIRAKLFPGRHPNAANALKEA